MSREFTNPVEFITQVRIDDMPSGDNEPFGFSKEGWYFWDETWAHAYGPFNTEKECNDKLTHYVVHVLGI